MVEYCYHHPIIQMEKLRVKIIILSEKVAGQRFEARLLARGAFWMALWLPS